MPAFFVALRESVHDPKEMRLYADKAAGSATGHRLVTRVAYGRLRMTEKPTGKSFNTMTLDVFTVRDGKLASAYHVENWMTALQQIGR